MKKIILLSVIITLVACGSLKEAGKVMRNEKTNSTDEFLVKKRKPLILPPDYNELPKPGTNNSINQTDDEKKIKQILKVPDEKKSKGTYSSLEKSIIDRIRKW